MVACATQLARFLVSFINPQKRGFTLYSRKRG